MDALQEIPATTDSTHGTTHGTTIGANLDFGGMVATELAYITSPRGALQTAKVGA